MEDALAIEESPAKYTEPDWTQKASQWEVAWTERV